MPLDNAAALCLPVAVQYAPVYMALVRGCLPSQAPGDVEIYMHDGAGGIIKIKDCPYGAFAFKAAVMRSQAMSASSL